MNTLSPASPSPRSGSGVALFGGFNNGTYLDDTWRFTGTTWKKVKSPGPSARSAHGFAFDPALGGAVLFGGRNLNIPQYFGETWLLS